MDRRLTRAMLIALSDKLGVFDEEGNIQGVERHLITPMGDVGGRPIHHYVGQDPAQIREMAGSDEAAQKVYTALGITAEQADEAKAQAKEKAAAQEEPAAAPAPEATSTTAPEEEFVSATGVVEPEPEPEQSGLKAYRDSKSTEPATPPADPSTTETGGGKKAPAKS
jgi:hypothetical protein